MNSISDQGNLGDSIAYIDANHEQQLAYHWVSLVYFPLSVNTIGKYQIPDQPLHNCFGKVDQFYVQFILLQRSLQLNKKGKVSRIWSLIFLFHEVLVEQNDTDSEQTNQANRQSQQVLLLKDLKGNSVVQSRMGLVGEWYSECSQKVYHKNGEFKSFF